jgi:hypothetical protein
MDGNNPSQAGEGPGIIRQNAIASFGENARNFYVLSVLAEIRAQVFGL